ncbi:MAG: hypothetical protein JNK30_00205 [Phenylobacterium sp.]|uniref:DUF5655 domain-containing protein n=1 Tax=Phenylobacterium sp. TaxID=1871053 RepID=UPI001A5EF98A|nr:DUF5655 domain-containing protein [Phenylobacterium sp.]MBL8769774.1 hypothetical protein [Phenylobacterium sp.]
MAQDWRVFRDENAARLERQTGQDVAAWNARIAAAALPDVDALRAWLKAQGVTGYSAQLLRWETFGYPDFMTASADELVDAQFADRPALRPVYDAVIAAALALGDVTVQTRKTYVSLVGPRRTFARVQPTTRTRLDVGLRLDAAPGAGLRPNRIHESMPVGLALARPEDLDAQALDWLRKAYDANA